VTSSKWAQSLSDAHHHSQLRYQYGEPTQDAVQEPGTEQNIPGYIRVLDLSGLISASSRCVIGWLTIPIQLFNTLFFLWFTAENVRYTRYIAYQTNNLTVLCVHALARTPRPYLG
jgi:hypothetical protein